MEPKTPLATNPVFAGAAAPARARLLAVSTLRSYAACQRVLTEGEPARHVFALESGQVRVFHASPDGAEVLLKLFSAPALFGEAEAFSGGVYLENVDATIDAEVLVMPAEALLAFLREDARAAVTMLIDVAARLAIASHNEKSLAFAPVATRLANYLVDCVGLRPDRDAATLALTQDDMAAAIGATRRSVAKSVIAWQRAGILQRRGDRYLVRDPVRLGELADPQHVSLRYSLVRLRVPTR